MKKLLLVFAITAFGLTSCKKEDMSKYATKEDLTKSNNDNKANVFTVNLGFSQNLNNQTVNITKSSPDDIVLAFMNPNLPGESKTWLQCPAIIDNLNVLTENSDSSITVYMFKSNGQAGSPFSSIVFFDFKFVVISTSQFQANPNLDYSNYDAVKEKFSISE